MIGQLVAIGLRIAFWLPLAACTWLALMPSPPGPLFTISDAILHAGAFAYLTLAARFAFASMPGWVVVLCMLGYGALLEVLQGLGGVRIAEARDLAMDLAGIAAGLLIFALVGARVRRLLARISGRPLR